MDAATIHESNRLRVSLGMKPLPIPGAQPPQAAESAAASDSDGEAASTLESRQAQAQDNYRSYMENNLMKKRREAKAAAVRKAREAAQRFTLLEGTGLGEANEGGDLDTKSWLKGHKKRRKTIEIAKKYEEEVAEAEVAAAKTVRYTSKDLAGVKVAHDASAFLEGSHQILTLKDATIEENEEEGDELENINLREDEKLADRLELKKKRPAYDPYDEQDGKRGILSQYDEEIEGKKTKNFSLDSNGAMSELSDLLRLPVRRTSNMKNVNVDDIIEDAPVSSDYLAPSDIKIRKPKKKKERTLRQRHSNTDSLISPDFIKADANAMDVGNGQLTGLKRKSDADLFVDDDLQAALAIQRMHALKSRRKSSMAEFVKRVKETPDEPDLPKEQTGGLIIGEVSEFISGLSQHHEDDDEMKARRKMRAVKRSQTPETLGTDMVEDDPMSTNVEVMDGNGITQSKDVMVAASEQGSIFDQEKMVGSSLSETLALLRERGLLEDSRGDNSHKSQLERQEFLRKKRQLEKELDEKARQQRDRDRKSGKLDSMSRADREEYARQQNAWRDHQHSRRMAELILSAYKPSVELKYTDEHGRQLDSKEAFKHLSHQFHGKGSGKGKTEKKLKQIEDEKRRTAQSLFDASQVSGMNAATAQQLKKRKEAGVRLG